MARTGLTGRRITVPKNTTKRVTSSKPKKEKTFKEAFAEARKKHGGGGGTFTWRNKKYTTDYKSEKKKPTPPIPKEKPTQKKSLKGYGGKTTIKRKPTRNKEGLSKGSKTRKSRVITYEPPIPGARTVDTVIRPTDAKEPARPPKLAAPSKPKPDLKPPSKIRKPTRRTTTAITKSQIQKDREQAIKDTVKGLWSKVKKGFTTVGGAQKSASRAGGGVIIHIGAGKALRGQGKVRRRKGGRVY